MMENKDHEQVGKNEIEPDFENLPKTRFEQIDIDRETQLVYQFMGSRMHTEIYDNMYPELRVIQKESKDREERHNRYKKFLEDIHAQNSSQMLSAQEQVQIEWNKVGPAFLKALSEHLETEWPKDKREIVGYVSVLPSFPRFLDMYSFCVGYKDIPKMIEVSAHEILHFLWFKKWKEVFPEMDSKEYEAPHLVWRLSEIMDPIILQCQPEIKELIKPRQWGYRSFKKIQIEDMGMTEYFKKIYVESVAAGDDFAVILKKLWDEAQKHEKEISAF